MSDKNKWKDTIWEVHDGGHAGIPGNSCTVCLPSEDGKGCYPLAELAGRQDDFKNACLMAAGPYLHTGCMRALQHLTDFPHVSNKEELAGADDLRIFLKAILRRSKHGLGDWQEWEGDKNPNYL